MIDTERLALEANQRIAYFVNRCAGQHIRQMRERRQLRELQQSIRLPVRVDHVWFVGSEPKEIS